MTTNNQWGMGSLCLGSIPGWPSWLSGTTKWRSVQFRHNEISPTVIGLYAASVHCSEISPLWSLMHTQDYFLNIFQRRDRSDAVYNW